MGTKFSKARKAKKDKATAAAAYSDDYDESGEARLDLAACSVGQNRTLKSSSLSSA